MRCIVLVPVRIHNNPCNITRDTENSMMIENLFGKSLNVGSNDDKKGFR
jgi:hypothetical protein